MYWRIHDTAISCGHVAHALDHGVLEILVHLCQANTLLKRVLLHVLADPYDNPLCKIVSLVQIWMDPMWILVPDQHLVEAWCMFL